MKVSRVQQGFGQTGDLFRLLGLKAEASMSVHPTLSESLLSSFQGELGRNQLSRVKQLTFKRNKNIPVQSFPILCSSTENEQRTKLLGFSGFYTKSKVWLKLGVT